MSTHLQPVLTATGLQHWLGEGAARNHVLRGVDLAIAPGEVVAVVGPSGCGKSTLLYLLGLLDRPTEGAISLLDQNCIGLSDTERTARRNTSIGFVFQFHFLLPEFSAAENVMLPMRKAGGNPVEMRQRAEQLLDAVGLSDKYERPGTHLSGGEQQRVAIARALANQPAVILADEPTGNLDAANSERVFAVLRKAAREHRAALLLVTHNPDLAGRCDRILRMADGKIVAIEAGQP